MTATFVNAMSIPERVERPAEQPDAAERDEQADTGDGRRQHERQLDERDEHVPQHAPRRSRSSTRRACRSRG